MIERFFFDRVNTKAAAQAISCQNHFTGFVLADKTESSFPFQEDAATRAQQAGDLISFKFFPISADILLVCGAHDSQSCLMADPGKSHEGQRE